MRALEALEQLDQSGVHLVLRDLLGAQRRLFEDGLNSALVVAAHLVVREPI